MIKSEIVFVIAAMLCQLALGAISVTAPAGGNLDQFDSYSIQWNSDDPGDGAAVSIILRQGGGNIATLASGVANAVGSNNWSWNISQSAGSNYTIRVVSDSNGLIYGDSSSFDIVAPTISASAGNINQLDNLSVSWSVTGVISNDVTITISENGESANVTGGATSYNFATDTSATWSPGTYTITVTSDDQPTISDTITADISASAISSVAVGNINQFENMSITWSETGTIGGTVTVTAVNGGFSDSTTVAAGTLSATFSTDNTWPTGTYTATVTSDTYGVLTDSDTCTVSASAISSVTVGNINQFQNMSITWAETGTIGGTVTVTAVNGGFSDSTTVAAGTLAATFATDNTWPTGTYTVTVTSDDHGALNDNDTCTVSASSISSVSVGNINQFQNMGVTWSETGTIGGTVTVTLVNGGFSDSAIIAAGIGTAVFATDNTWPTGTYTATVTSDTYGVLTDSDTCILSLTDINSVSVSDINQFDNMSVTWSETGTIGGTVTVTVVNGGFSDSTTVAAGTLAASFATDNTWPAGTYTVTVTSDDHGALTDNDTCSVSASAISSVTVGNINQFQNMSITWAETGTIGGTVTVTAVNGGFSDSTTVAAGTLAASFATDNTWPAGTYTVTVTSDDHGALTDNDTCSVSASAISSVTVGNINQFQNMSITWAETGTIGGTVTVTAVNGGFSDSTTVAAGTLSATFATDNTWPAGTYTVTVVSDDHGVLNDNDTCTVSASSISSVSVGNINQFENMSVTWAETGTIGGTVTITAVNGGFSDSTTVAAGTLAATFATDNTWPAGTYTITVTSDTYGAISNSNTCTVSASLIDAVSVANLNQFDMMTVTWNESGTIGGTITVTVVNGGFSDTANIAAGTNTASFTTDNTWPAGTYTATVTSDTFGILTDSDTCTLTASTISSVTVGNINQFDIMSVTWNETGTIGGTVTVTAVNGGFSDSTTVAAGTLAASFTTDNTWPTGAYTVTVISDDHGVLTDNDTCTVNVSSISSAAVGNINQFENLSVSWTESGNVGATLTITAVNGGFSNSTSVTAGTGTATIATDNTWPTGTYTVSVTSDDHGILTDNDTCTISASSISSVSAGNINQYDTLTVTWAETGTLGATIRVTASQSGFSQSTTVAAGTLTASMVTDDTWPTGSVTITVKSVTHSLATASSTVTISPTAVSVGAIAGINQYNTLTVNWIETGTIGANTIVTVTNGGFSQSDTVSTGTLTTSFTTDDTWPAGTYTVEVKLADHTSVTDSTTFILTETNITLNTLTNFNQFDNISLSWIESGSVGATVDITIKLGASTIATDQISTGIGTWSIATDETWTLGTYTAIVTLTDHPVRTSSDTFTFSETNISLTQPVNINQFDNISLSWSYLGSFGSNVDIKIVRNSDSTVVSSQTISSISTTASIATDNSATWPVGTYTATVTLTDHPIRTVSKTFTISQTAILSASTSVDGSSANQLDTITLNWTSTGTIGNINLKLYRGATLIGTIAPGTLNDGILDWKILYNVSPGTGYFIRVESSLNPTQVYLDAPLTFELLETSITANSPGNITQFDNQTITWSTTGSVGPTVTAKIMRTSGETLATATGVSTAAGTYTFSSDLSWTAASNYYARVESELHSECFDNSDTFFTVNPTAITIISAPDIDQLDSQTVSWSKAGNVGANVTFQLYLGATLIDQQTLSANTYTYTTDLSWTVGTYTINIISQDHPTVIGTTTFELGPTKIHLSEPVEDVYWQAGAQHRIGWISQGAAGATLTINLYKNESLVTTLSGSASNAAEEFIFTLSDSITPGVYQVKAISNAYPLLTSYFSSNITVTEQSIGGYIFDEVSDPYGTGISGVTVTITGPDGNTVLSTNNMGYWSTGEIIDGDYTITPTIYRRHFEKVGSPDAGATSTTFTLNSSTRSGSHSIMFDGVFNVKFVVAGSGGDGSSWANASGNLQSMIDAVSADPDDFYAEVWVEAGNYNGPITLENNAHVIGSLSGTEDPSTFNLNERDFINNASSIIGDGGTGHIVDGSDTNSTAIIDGFSISNGSGSTGAAIYIENATGTGIYNCTFIKNSATNSGGAITCLNSSLSLLYSIFKGNTAGKNGGAIYLANNSTVNANTCTFVGNFSPWGGGAIHGQLNSQVTLNSCTVASNESYLSGGVEVNKNSSLYMTNSLLYFNSSFDGQTLAGQYTTDGSGALSISSCYIQGTGAADPLFLSNPDSGNGTWGDGDDNYGDVHLRSTSPCINHGNNSIALSLDRDGDVRIYKGTIDIGSDECLFANTTVNSGEVVTLAPTGEGTGALVEETYVALNNTSGGSGSNINVIQISDNINPTQSAYKVVGATLVVETDLADGDYVMTLTIPFNSDDLAGSSWNTILLSYYNTGTSSWVNAGTGSQWLEQISEPTMTDLRSRPLGDYGIYWDSSEQKGFAWVNVDHTTDFAPIIYIKPGDFDKNNIVDTNDFIKLTEKWMMTNNNQYWSDKYDISEPKDGVIDLCDFTVIAENWMK